MPKEEALPLMTPIKAIRHNCLECCCGSAHEVARCTLGHKCALWPYRFGCRPSTNRSVLKRKSEGDE